MKPLTLLALCWLCLLFASAFIVASSDAFKTPETIAHEYPEEFIFEHPTLIGVENRLTDAVLKNNLGHAISEWDSTSELDVESGPRAAASPYLTDFSNIIYIQANFGNIGFVASAAQTMDNLRLCFNTRTGWPDGTCDTGDNKADFAYIAVNEFHRDDFESGAGAKAKNILTHEIGHVIGIDHSPCSTASIMKSRPYAACPTYETELQTHDTDDVSDAY